MSGAASRPSRAFPPVVYAPTVPDDGDGDGQARLELIELVDGRRALFAYSALDRLAEFYRADAGWVLLTVADLQRAHEQVPYDVLFLDRRPQLPGQAPAAPSTAETPGDGGAGDGPVTGGSAAANGSTRPGSRPR